MCRTKIIEGRGSLQYLKKLDCRRLMLVTDPYFIKNGTAGQVAELTGAENVEIFDRVQPDPTVELAAEGTARLREFGPDHLIFLGGGSALDCGKAMAFFAGLPIKTAAIPTTSGSGSEVTDFAILTHDGIKYPLVDKRLAPDLAILDGELLDELPPALIADTGFDVLSHALEAAAALGRNGFTDALAREAFCRVYRGLLLSFRGDKSLRQSVHEGSSMAGLAFQNAGLGLCHGLSHALGGQFHIPHGRLNAILLPEIVGYNARESGAQYAAAARAAGIPGAADGVAVRNLQRGLAGLRRELKMPGTLQEAGVSLQALREKEEKLIAAALEDGCTAGNPRKPSYGEVREILYRVAGHE